MLDEKTGMAAEVIFFMLHIRDSGRIRINATLKQKSFIHGGTLHNDAMPQLDIHPRCLIKLLLHNPD